MASLYSAQYLSDLAKEAERLSQENENLRWELKFKTKDLEHAVQTVEWKNKEIKVLKKENNELKTENENYKKNVSFLFSLLLRILTVQGNWPYVLLFFFFWDRICTSLGVKR